MKPHLSALTLILLAACSSSDPRLMNFSSNSTGPNEFLVAPAKPLETPPQAGSLPPPTLGGANRADATPFSDAVVALGGRESALAGSQIPSGDAGLVNYASRTGRDPLIRQTLAREDLEFRQKNPGRVLERVANVNVYYRAYEPQSLDQQSELARFRRAGVPTPAAPPFALK